MLPVGCLRLRAKATLARGRRFVPIRFDGAGWFGGLGSVSVAGAPRADPCGALPRRARPRTPPRLAGAKYDPSPPSRGDFNPVGFRGGMPHERLVQTRPLGRGHRPAGPFRQALAHSAQEK